MVQCRKICVFIRSSRDSSAEAIKTRTLILQPSAWTETYIKVVISDSAIILHVHDVGKCGLAPVSKRPTQPNHMQDRGQWNHPELLKGIANGHCGMKASNTARLVQALVISCLANVASYIKQQVTERMKPDRLIHKACKCAIGLTTNTSTDRFLELGLHNSTLDTLIEPHN